MGTSKQQQQSFYYLCKMQTKSNLAERRRRQWINTLPSLDLCSSGTSPTRHSKKGFWQKPSRSSSEVKADHFTQMETFHLSVRSNISIHQQPSDKTHQKHQYLRRLRNKSNSLQLGSHLKKTAKIQAHGDIAAE